MEIPDYMMVWNERTYIIWDFVFNNTRKMTNYVEKEKDYYIITKERRIKEHDIINKRLIGSAFSDAHCE